VGRATITGQIRRGAVVHLLSSRRIAGPGLAALATALGILAPAARAEASADVVVSAQAERQVYVGERLSYLVVVRNDGPDAAAARLRLTWSRRTRVRRVQVDQGTCSNDRVVTCDIEELTAGRAATVSIIARPARPGSTTATARGSSEQPDPDPSSNVATVATRVMLRRHRCANPWGGSRGRDVFHGTLGGDRLVGLAGGDRLFGGRGDDCLFGEEGNDHLNGGRGDDTLSGGEDSDVLVGGPGDDALRSGSGGDEIFAGSGDDRINGTGYSAGNSFIDCGPGKDRAIVREQSLAIGCEHVIVVVESCDETEQRRAGGGRCPGLSGRGPLARHCRHRHRRLYCPVGGVTQKPIFTRRRARRAR
jgi:hypothetical protein